MWQKQNWWALLIVVLGVLSACTPEIQSEQVEYVGRVLDAETLEPVAQAQVTFSFTGAPPVVYTDSQGVYRFLLVMDEETPLPGQIVVREAGYEPYFLNVTLRMGTLSLEDVRLKRQVIGQVTATFVPTTNTLTIPQTTPTVITTTLEASATIPVATPPLLPSNTPTEWQ